MPRVACGSIHLAQFGQLGSLPLSLSCCEFTLLLPAHNDLMPAPLRNDGHSSAQHLDGDGRGHELERSLHLPNLDARYQRTVYAQFVCLTGSIVTYIDTACVVSLLI